MEELWKPNGWKNGRMKKRKNPKMGNLKIIWTLRSGWFFLMYFNGRLFIINILYMIDRPKYNVYMPALSIEHVKVVHAVTRLGVVLTKWYSFQMIENGLFYLIFKYVQPIFPFFCSSILSCFRFSILPTRWVYKILLFFCSSIFLAGPVFTPGRYYRE